MVAITGYIRIRTQTTLSMTTRGFRHCQLTDHGSSAIGHQCQSESLLNCLAAGRP